MTVMTQLLVFLIDFKFYMFHSIFGNYHTHLFNLKKTPQ